jgi:glycosyltransferase involved in cell wall biosynthesis
MTMHMTTKAPPLETLRPPSDLDRNDLGPSLETLMALSMSEEPLRVCYASLSRPKDRQAFSGTVFQIAEALNDQRVVLDHLGRLQHRQLFLAKLVERSARSFGGRGYQAERTRSIALRMGRQIAQHLRQNPAQVLFSPGTIPLALLDHPIPKVFFTDATFRGLRGLYPELQDYRSARVAEGEELERMAIQRCDRSVYTSSWAAHSAVEHYGADPAKVRVLAYGSGFGKYRTAGEVEKAITARSTEVCHLLLVGVSWVRKGGDLALEVVERLRAQGLDARLTVVGCKPPVHKRRAHMEVHPFLAIDRTSDREKLLALFERSHFLLVPSLAECFGLVYAEASSMGLPSIARNSGGVNSAITEGDNGFVFPYHAGPDEYVRRIQGLWQDRPAYDLLCRSAYREYAQRLNWNSVGQELLAILREVAIPMK